MHTSDDQPVLEIKFDGRSGIGVTVERWGAVDQPLVALTFKRHFHEDSHDLTLDQATQLRDLLTRVLD
jgi:hypothetical protein